MTRLFSSLKLRNLDFKNRVFVLPMCQCSSENGLPNDWHLVQLGARVVGRAALVFVEATVVSQGGKHFTRQIKPIVGHPWNLLQQIR
ncbi:MAG: hypothetical protein JSW39_00895 [Desulfobacterales bacterium]|nr:MAG: hypothetical protein JSW39_00895 [Desulfobacterales bacterium]